MSLAFAIPPIVAIYDYALQPVPAFATVGAPISALDIAGALRLALILRQQREVYRKEHLALTSARDKNVPSERYHPPAAPSEHRSRVRDFATTFVMVFSGEAVVAPWLGLQPTFLVSPSGPLLFLTASALVESLPTVPELSLFTELPLSFLDGFTRAILLCNFVPSMIATHTSLSVSTSPYALLLTAFIAANAGPFFVNMFSLLQPTPMSATTPPELLPYGWTATDLWVAPLVTGLYATLTHAQPFFANLHTLLFLFLSPLGLAQLSFQDTSPGKYDAGSIVVPLDPDDARAVCVIVLSALFALRAVRAFGSGIKKPDPPFVRLVTDVPIPVLSAAEGEELEKELAARVAGAGKGYTRATPFISEETKGLN